MNKTRYQIIEDIRELLEREGEKSILNEVDSLESLLSVLEKRMIQAFNQAGQDAQRDRKSGSYSDTQAADAEILSRAGDTFIEIGKTINRWSSRGSVQRQKAKEMLVDIAQLALELTPVFGYLSH